MRQVPQYLIIGSGRVARHFQHYFSLLNFDYENWDRRTKSSKELRLLCQRSTHVLLLISDSAIEEFVEQNLFLREKILVHFSGSLTLADIYGAHPLCTFSSTLYDLKTYQEVPFIIEESSKDLSFILPGLINPYFKINSSMKSYYHALCVISGNFTTLLWQKFFAELEVRFKIPKTIAFPYLTQTMKNLMDNSHNALTGPLVRDDKKTIESNLQSLDQDPFKEIYQAFVNVFTYASRQL